MASNKKKSLLGRFKIALAIFGIILVPMIMDQAQMNNEDVKLVGRVCGGIAGIFTIYGIFTKILGFFAITILAVIALAVLVSEDIIDAPHLMSYFS